MSSYSINHLAVWAFKERRLGVFGYALLDAVLGLGGGPFASRFKRVVD